MIMGGGAPGDRHFSLSMFCAVKSNSPLSAPRDDTAHASYGMG